MPGQGSRRRLGGRHGRRPDLLSRIQAGEIDTTFLISHRLPLEDTPRGYANCKTKQNEWTKVVLMPHGGASGSA